MVFALSRLPPEEKRLLYVLHIWDQSLQNICKIMHLSENQLMCATERERESIDSGSIQAQARLGLLLISLVSNRIRFQSI